MYPFTFHLLSCFDCQFKIKIKIWVTIPQMFPIKDQLQFWISTSWFSTNIQFFVIHNDLISWADATVIWKQFTRENVWNVWRWICNPQMGVRRLPRSARRHGGCFAQWIRHQKVDTSLNGEVHQFIRIMFFEKWFEV